MPSELDDPRFHPPFDGTWYRVREELDHGVCEYSLTLPSGFEHVNLATVHVERIGGDSAEDLEFRKILYYLIGAGVVKSGQIEDGMKRLLILTGKRTEADFSVADLTWSDLHKKLKCRANRDGPPGNTLAKTLEWGETKKVKDARDNLIHASWWDYAGVGVRRTRFSHGGKNNIAIGTLDDLKQTVELLGQYEIYIDDCVGQFWPRAYLPADKPND